MMTLHERTELEQIARAVDNCAALANVLGIAIAETRKEAGGVMALCDLLARISVQIDDMARRGPRA